MGQYSEDFNNINNLLNALVKLGVNTDSYRRKLDEAGESTEKLKDLTELLGQKLSSVEGSASGLFETLQAVVSEIGSKNKALSIAESIGNKILNDTRKLRDDEQGITDLNKIQLQAIKEKVVSNSVFLKDQLANLELERKSLESKEKKDKPDQARLERLEAAIKFAKDEGSFQKNLVDKIEERLRLERAISKNMGVTGALVKGTGALMERLGMRSGIFHDAMQDAYQTMRDQSKILGENGNLIERSKIAFRGLIKVAKGFGAALFDPLILMKTLLDTFFKIDKLYVESARLTGQMASNFDASVLSAATMVDYMRTTNELTKQTGLNAQNAFSKKNIEGAANLTKEMGLSAEEAGNIAMMAQVSTRNVEQLTDSIVKTTSTFNKTNKTAVSQGIVLRDIGKVSEGIRASFGGSTKELVKSVAAARRLGINISELDNIAKGLLDFESSIENELEAQLMTGRQINLGKARQLALDGDLNKLGEELFKNSATLLEYGSMNRLQQEAQAKALGMTRDQLAKVAYQRGVELKMTDEQLKKASGVEASDMRRVEAQENFAAAVEKIAAAFAPVMEFLASIVSIPWVPKMVLGGVAAVKLLGSVKSIAGRFSKIRDSIKGMVTQLKLAGKVQANSGEFWDKNSSQGRMITNMKKGRGKRAESLSGKATPKTPPIDPKTAKGTKGLTDSISKIDTKKLLQGALAMAAVAGALFIFAKSAQELEKVKDWGNVAIGLGAFAISMGVLGAVGAYAGPGIIALGKSLIFFGLAMKGPGGLGLLAIVGAAVGIGAAFALVGAGAMMFGKGIEFAANGVVKIFSGIKGLISSIPQLYLLGGALMSIAAGLGAISVAGILALPTLLALTRLGMVATPLAKIMGNTGTESSSEENTLKSIEKKLISINDHLAKGTNVYLDSEKIFSSASQNMAAQGAG